MDAPPSPQTFVAPVRGSVGEVFLAFLGLGLTSFGGPVAHLGYFREALVKRRRWLSEAAYADIVALAQFLPGPASSQTGFALGWLRAGPWGGLAAWTAFTLPSALLMVAFAIGAPLLGGSDGTGLIHGLKLVAVAVVAQAVWGMARTLTPDLPRLAIAVAAGTLVYFVPGALAQMGAIALGAAAGFVLPRVAAGPDDAPGAPVSRRVGAWLLLAFAMLLVALPLLAAVSDAPSAKLADTFYRAGALVFGGGHVVLPLLEAETAATGWIGRDAFLAGYGAAQAVPGPLFTFAAYLGAVIDGPAGAGVALVAMFLPGLLLMIGALPFWHGIRRAPAGQALMRGANAAVVGVLAAALYDPVATSAIAGWVNLALALAGFLALTLLRAPPLAVVAALATAGLAIA